MNLSMCPVTAVCTLAFALSGSFGLSLLDLSNALRQLGAVIVDMKLTFNYCECRNTHNGLTFSTEMVRIVVVFCS